MLKKIIVAIYLLLFSVTSSAATVVTASVVPGSAVGSNDGGYPWAGYVKLDINGAERWAATDFLLTSLSDPTWYINSTPREMILYTREDILTSAPVAYAQSGGSYDLAAQFFLYGLLWANSGDVVGAAAFNEMIWETMDTVNGPNWYYGNNTADPGPPAVTFVDVHNNLLSTFSAEYNFDPGVGILFDPYSMDREFFVQMVAIPVPPAVWLFGSGLLWLVAVARTRTTRK